MLKSLYPKVDWDKVEVIGFDLDGTLYDEFNFIQQVYESIAEFLSAVLFVDQRVILAKMLERWLEKGSSYNRIFDEAIEFYQPDHIQKKEWIQQCLKIYREFSPELILPNRSKYLLNFCKDRYSLFLVTDGAFELQQRKFKALQLQHWFEPNNVGYTGKLGSDSYKPATIIIDHIDVLKKERANSSVVFFGDRLIDEEFAARAGFQFVKTKCLYEEGL